MITPTKKDLEERLDWFDSEIMELQDKITDLKRERDRVANTLDDIIDAEGAGT